jgi:hypothetical protein
VQQHSINVTSPSRYFQGSQRRRAMNSCGAMVEETADYADEGRLRRWRRGPWVSASSTIDLRNLRSLPSTASFSRSLRAALPSPGREIRYEDKLPTSSRAGSSRPASSPRNGRLPYGPLCRHTARSFLPLRDERPARPDGRTRRPRPAHPGRPGPHVLRITAR